MRFLFSLPSRASQWIIFLISVLTATSVTYFLVSGINAFTQISQIFFVADAYQLNDSFIYSTYDGFDYTTDQKQSVREDILSVKGIKDVNLVSSYTLSFPSLNGMFVTCINYNDTLLQNVRVNLSEGDASLMGEENRVFLPAYCKNYCKLGDTISGFVNAMQADGSVAETTVSVTVAGFLAEQPTFQAIMGGTGLDLATLFSAHTGAYFDDIAIDNGIVWRLTDEKGETLIPDYSNMFIVRTDGSIPIQQCDNALRQVVESPALLFSGEELINKHIETTSDEIGATFAFLLTAAALSFSLLTASTALELIYRQKEMAILYLSGASWNQCLWSVLMSQILPMIIGFPLGLLILNAKNFINLFYFLQPRLVLPEVILALGIEILFVSAAVLPFRFSTKFKTPHELFRKD